MSDQDPIRWSVAEDAPRGAADLVRSIERPPRLPPDLRGLSRRELQRARLPSPRPSPGWRTVGAALATGVVIGGLTVWVIRSEPREELAAIREPERALLEAPASPPAAIVSPAPIPPLPPPIVPPAAEPASESPNTVRRGVHPSTDLEVRSSPRVPQRVAESGPEASDDDLAVPPEAISPERTSPEAISPERTSPEAPSLEPEATSRRPAAEGGTGYLMIESLPWARVFLDGRDTGQNTPIRRLSVSAGTHRIGLLPSHGEMHVVVVEVEAGETVRIVRQL